MTPIIDNGRGQAQTPKKPNPERALDIAYMVVCQCVPHVTLKGDFSVLP